MNHKLPRRACVASLLLVSSLVLSLASPASADPIDTSTMKHGARAKAGDGTMIVWDKVDGVFMVPDRKDTYWADDRFYQCDGGVWTTAKVLAGPWTLVAEKLVPDAARGRHAAPREAVTAKLPGGREAVYEPKLKVYKVAGRKGVFLFDALFYRYDGGVWLESTSDDGPWAPGSQKVLPQVLRRAVPAPEAGAQVTLPSGEKVTWDDEARVFDVDGKPGLVLFDGTFYQKQGEGWTRSATSSTGFEKVEAQSVPGPVRFKFRKAPSGEKKAKGDKARDKKTKKAGANKDKKAKKAGGKKAKSSPPATAGDENE